MLDTAKLSTLIGHIYDCVPDPDRWDDVMDMLCCATESRIGTISIITASQRRLDFGSMVGPKSIIDPLRHELSHQWPILDMLPSMQEGQPYLMSEIAGSVGNAAGEAQDSAAYGEWRRRHGLADGYSVALCKLPEETICLDLIMSVDRRPLTEADRRQFASLVPHIMRAGKVGMMLNTIAHQSDALQQVASRMTDAVLIVSRNMQILEANPAASRMLVDGTLIRSLRGRLVVNNAAAAARIEQDVKLSSFMEDQLDGASSSIPLGDSFNPSIARVIPLAKRDLDRRLVNAAAAAIFITQAGKKSSLASDAFGQLYALTAAEGRIARLTAEGFGRAAIAGMLGIKEATVKSHLESIFSKTGASGQLALTILMRSLSPPLRQN